MTNKEMCSSQWGGIRYLRLKLIYCLCPILTFRYKMHYRPLNLNRLQFFIDSGRLNPNAPITMYHLWRSGVTGGRIKDGVVLLGGDGKQFSSSTFMKMMHFDCSRINRIFFRQVMPSSFLSQESISISKNYNRYVFDQGRVVQSWVKITWGQSEI